jgi:hypothetical protein
LWAALCCPRIEAVPEITQILAYSLEHGLSLFIPLTQLKAKSQDELRIARTAVSSLWQTWPGMLAFGIRAGTFVDLIRCLPHQRML